MAWRLWRKISGGPRKRFTPWQSNGTSARPGPRIAHSSPPSIAPRSMGRSLTAAAMAISTQAVEVSKALKRPIKVVWTREEDIRSDRYRPQAALRMRAALRDDGAPAGFDFTT